MSQALLTSLSNVLENTDNSGNTIATEYSLFLPNNMNPNNNSPSNSNNNT